MMAWLTPRKCFLLGFLASVLAMAIALFFELVMHFLPCPLCIFQRVGVIGAGIILLIGFIHGPKRWGIKVYALLSLIPLIFGLVVAARQVWLQHLPADQVPACGPGLNYLLKVLPLDQVITTVFKGSGDCATVHWQFLGLSIAGYSGLFFIAMIIWVLWQLVRKP